MGPIKTQILCLACFTGSLLDSGKIATAGSSEPSMVRHVQSGRGDDTTLADSMQRCVTNLVLGAAMTKESQHMPSVTDTIQEWWLRQGGAIESAQGPELRGNSNHASDLDGEERPSLPRCE